jgi:hypothetical protein
MLAAEIVRFWRSWVERPKSYDFGYDRFTTPKGVVLGFDGAAVIAAILREKGIA